MYMARMTSLRVTGAAAAEPEPVQDRRGYSVKNTLIFLAIVATAVIVGILRLAL
jgi:hypothetical protein